MQVSAPGNIGEHKMDDALRVELWVKSQDITIDKLKRMVSEDRFDVVKQRLGGYIRGYHDGAFESLLLCSQESVEPPKPALNNGCTGAKPPQMPSYHDFLKWVCTDQEKDIRTFSEIYNWFARHFAQP